MKLWHNGIMAATLVCLAGCSSIGLGSKRIDYKSSATQIPTLELPPDLTAQGNDESLKISGDSVATFSSFSKTNAINNAQNSTVLPVAKGVYLEREGNQRWLKVEDKPENVWPVVKSFWASVGLAVKTEDQAAGIMVTDWSENRASIPDSPIRSVIGKVFDNLYSSGERDQYRVRLERSKDGKATDIFITHRGLAEVLSQDKTISKWEPRPEDPELEAEMLQRLMVAFGKSQAEAEQALANAAAGVPVAKTEKALGAAKLQSDASGEKVIIISDPFDRSWRRVGLAIDSAELTVDDRDRTTGLYLLKLAKQESSSWWGKLKFWQGRPDPKARYRVTVKDNGESCEVSVTNQDGKVDDTSKQMLEAIFKNIN
jgi:outer membrane protein assembly factor BamC